MAWRRASVITLIPAVIVFTLISTCVPTGEISAQDSFFTYPEGMSAADYSFPNHEPIFADEAADSVPQDVLDACGDNQECIFDAIQTGNLEIGMETLTTNNGNIDDQNQASKCSTVCKQVTLYNIYSRAQSLSVACVWTCVSRPPSIIQPGPKSLCSMCLDLC